MPRLIPLPAALEEETLRELSRHLRSGGVVGIPTDTLYGLAADPFSEEGVARVFALKGRGAEKSLPVLVAGVEELSRLGVSAAPARLAALARLWPAPVTAVLRLARAIPASGGRQTLAVRVPAVAALRRLLQALGPLTATSANPSGEPPSRSAAEVARRFGEELPFVLDGGSSPEALPSTLVDLSGPTPRVLRPGAISVAISLFE